MGRKVISFGLSTSEINRAMKELADYKQEILRKTELLREKVAERLADEAKSGFSGAIVDELILKGGQTSPRYAQVDVSVDNRGSVTVVVASGEDAVWVEFGAGVYVEEAYPINKKTVEEAELKKEKAKSEKGLRYMQAYMVQANKQLQERK